MTRRPTPKLTFDAIVAAFHDDPRVTPPTQGKRAFGSSALQVDGKIFAMVVSDQFVLKLPKHRVTALVLAGEGAPFTSGAGRVMKEWVVIVAGPSLELAREARAFVGGA